MMANLETIRLKIADLKAKVEQKSISPLYLGQILDELVTTLSTLSSDEINSLRDSLSKTDNSLNLLFDNLDKDFVRGIEVAESEAGVKLVLKQYDPVDDGSTEEEVPVPLAGAAQVAALAKQVDKNTACINTLLHDMKIPIELTAEQNFYMSLDINISAGEQFEVEVCLSESDMPNRCALDYRYAGSSAWERGVTVNTGAPITLTSEKEITGLRLFANANNIPQNVCGLFSLKKGVSLVLENLVSQGKQTDAALEQISDRVTELSSSVGTLTQNATKDREDITTLNVKMLSLAGSGGPIVETAAWTTGYYNQDATIEANSPTSRWRRADIVLTATEGVTVKANIVSNPITFCLVTDGEGSILWSRANVRTLELDLTQYPTAKHVLLSADCNSEYSAQVVYPEVKGLSARMDELAQSVADIRGCITPGADISKMKVLVIGDSISTGDNPFGFPNYGNYDKWVDNLKDWGFFPADTVNNSLHASGFVVENPNTKLKIGDTAYKNSFLDRTKYLVDNGNIDLSTFDLIVVFGGINDFKDTSVEMGTAGSGDTTKFIPALEAFYAYLFDNAVQARICTLLPLRVSFNDTFRGVTIWEFRDAIKDVIRKYSIPYLDLTEQSGFAPLGSQAAKFRAMWTRDFDGSGAGDGVHPNAEYNRKYLSPQIMRFIRGVV